MGIRVCRAFVLDGGFVWRSGIGTVDLLACRVIVEALLVGREITRDLLKGSLVKLEVLLT